MMVHSTPNHWRRQLLWGTGARAGPRIPTIYIFSVKFRAALKADPIRTTREHTARTYEFTTRTYGPSLRPVRTAVEKMHPYTYGP